MYTHTYIHTEKEEWRRRARAGYHETRVPGVPLAGCVLRPGRAINYEVLYGKGERSRERAGEW